LLAIQIKLGLLFG